MDWFLCRKSKARSVCDRAESATGDLDPLLVVPADVGINDLDELLDDRGPPVSRIEQLRFQPTEEAFIGCIVRRACLARHQACKVRVVDS